MHKPTVDGVAGAEYNVVEAICFLEESVVFSVEKDFDAFALELTQGYLVCSGRKRSQKTFGPSHQSQSLP